jgi:protein-L-isoaspartate(D-aspartate) O-methyltransferase
MPAKLADLLNAIGAGSLPPHIVAAIEAVPRHHFLAEIYSDSAYKDAALPISATLTASRPSTVVAMLTALGRPRRVLEVGTGSGWQSALLTRFCAEVYSIEVHEGRAERAARDLRGYPVTLRQGNGLAGWPEAAPFDGILVCADLSNDASRAALIDQLTETGVMVAQVGGEICRIDKSGCISPIGKRSRFAPASPIGIA